MSAVEKKTWAEFRSAGLLWWVNRSLHLFGWAICVTVESNGSISETYPARVKFRGFDGESESEGFAKVTQYLAGSCQELLGEVEAKL